MKTEKLLKLLGYVGLAVGPVAVAFPSLSLDDLPATGWISFVGFGAFVAFLLGKHLEVAELKHRVLMLVSAATYGVVSCFGLQVANLLANWIGPIFALSGALVYEFRVSQRLMVFLGGIGVVGWFTALVFGYYPLVPSVASMIVGVAVAILFVQLVSPSDHNTQVGLAVLIMSAFVVLIGLTMYFWLSSIQEIAGSFFLGGIGISMVAQGFIWVGEPEAIGQVET